MQPVIGGHGWDVCSQAGAFQWEKHKLPRIVRAAFARALGAMLHMSTCTMKVTRKEHTQVQPEGNRHQYTSILKPSFQVFFFHLSRENNAESSHSFTYTLI